MSVYSGFATRQQQKRYNECLQYALAILTKRLFRFYTGEPCNDSKFIHLLTTIHDKMLQLEENKYLEPHFSHLLKDFLKSSAEIFGKVSQLTSIKDEDPFNQTFYKPSDSNLKAKFNTLQMREESEEELDRGRKQSRLTINDRKANFKTRIKTVVPENNERANYFTPQKQSRLQEQTQILKDKIQRESIFRTGERRSKQIGQSFSKGRALSPRQFLRQTVKGGQSFSTLGVRTKQKHQKLVKI